MPDLYPTDSAIYKDAIKVLKHTRRASTSTLQRRLQIGYFAASRLMDTLQANGIISSWDGCKPPEILVDLEKL